MEVIIPIGYSFFLNSKYKDPVVQKLLTKNILYTKGKWKICSNYSINRLIKNVAELGQVISLHA